ncbi:transmembrane protein [Cystoisospora suis]|uniref:Transmembrane protein n=1 Tax=Cystoisospora suis TaxID=483139 RepID=A0A2C6KTU5_9APIC|nr:transmembrane protein [Cystoisospora suis]
MVTEERVQKGIPTSEILEISKEGREIFASNCRSVVLPPSICIVDSSSSPRPSETTQSSRSPCSSRSSSSLSSCSTSLWWDPLVWFLLVGNFFIYLDRGIIPGTTVEINAFISSTTQTSSPDSLLGLLQSSFIAGLSVGSPCFGHAVHLYKPFLLLSVGLGVWTAALVTAALAAPAQSFTLLFLGRMLSGVGEAAFVAIAFPFLAGYAEKREKTSQGVYGAQQQPPRNQGGAIEEGQGRKPFITRSEGEPTAALSSGKSVNEKHDGAETSGCCDSRSGCSVSSPFKRKNEAFTPPVSPGASAPCVRPICVSSASSSPSCSPSSSCLSSCIGSPSSDPCGTRVPGSSSFPTACLYGSPAPSANQQADRRRGSDSRDTAVRVHEEEEQEKRKSSPLQGRLLGVFLCMLPLGVASGIAYGATAARFTALGWPVAYGLLACIGFILSLTACVFRDCTDDYELASSPAPRSFPCHRVISPTPLHTVQSGVASRFEVTGDIQPGEAEGERNSESSLSRFAVIEKRKQEVQRGNETREAREEKGSPVKPPFSLVEAHRNVVEEDTRCSPRVAACPLSSSHSVKDSPSLSDCESQRKLSARFGFSEDFPLSSSVGAPLSSPLLEKDKKGQQENNGEGDAVDVFHRGVPDHVRPPLPSSPSSAPSLWAETCILLSSRPFLFLCVAAASYAALCQALATFAANFLLGLGLFENELHAGLATGIVAAAAGLAGLFCFSCQILGVCWPVSPDNPNAIHTRRDTSTRLFIQVPMRVCINGFRGLACKFVYSPSSTHRWTFCVGVGMWIARKRGFVENSSTGVFRRDPSSSRREVPTCLVERSRRDAYICMHSAV